LFFFLPDSPASARFLNEEQKIIAVKRIASNRVSRCRRGCSCERPY
jgi:hypothetical protein